MRNGELYWFGLNNGHLPTHTTKALDYLKDTQVKIEVYSMDGKPAEGYYINYKNSTDSPDRVVSIGIRPNE